MSFKKNIVISATIVAFVVGIIMAVNRHDSPQSVQNKVDTANTSQTSNRQVNEFNKKQYSIDTPGSLWWIVNKNRPLPVGYTPPNLRVPDVKLRLSSVSEQMKLEKVTSGEVERMFKDAKSAGVSLLFASGFRSEVYQRQLYNSYVATDGQEAADRYSAKPGTSEHQTGMAFDVCIDNTSCELEQSFGATNEGKWVAEHAHEYGLIVRYLPEKESVTGYTYEPWHLRYVGKELATELHKNGLTMEEFFRL